MKKSFAAAFMLVWLLSASAYADDVSELWQKAQQGDVQAQFSSWRLHEHDENIPKDPSEAAKWFQKSADKGDAKGQYELGTAYEMGWGVPQSFGTANQWFTKSAAQGNAKAQYDLGFSYLKGRGVPEDKVAAYKWLILSAEKEHGASLARDEVEKLLTPEQVTAGKKMAQEWQPSAK